MSVKTRYSHLSDIELVILIQQNQDYLGEVYKRCKSYCIRFMRKMTGNKMNDYELDDVFHDAIIVLYEKIIKGDFVLTASLQVYLNSVCRIQLLNKIKVGKLNSDYQEHSDSDDDDSQMSYNPNITDTFDPTENSEEDKETAIETALEVMKTAGGHCYELITLFWYHKKSIAELTEQFGYTNDVNTRNQKAKCQKRLEKMTYNELHT
jgi:RNA polymerase sigma factor (sigma-70 family)